MSGEPLLPSPIPPPPSPDHFVRVEYLGFQNVAEHREFRLRVYGPERSTELRFRIAMAAFGDGRVRLQDGPDVCYQKLLLAISAGETVADAITIDDVDLTSYREAHTKVMKHRQSWTPPSPPTPAIVPRSQPRTPSPPRTVAPLVINDIEPALEEGQRVSHAVFGVGVTTSSSRGRTVVRFDQHGPKTFVTSMLKLDVLSAPRTWETGPRGNNRLCRTVSSDKR